jgi:hypothetical protein
MLSDEQLLARITSPHPTCRHGDELYPMYPQYEMSGRIVCWVCAECGCVVFPEVRKEANVLAESLKERDAEIAALKAELDAARGKWQFDNLVPPDDNNYFVLATFEERFEDELRWTRPRIFGGWYSFGPSAGWVVDGPYSRWRVIAWYDWQPPAPKSEPSDVS